MDLDLLNFLQFCMKVNVGFKRHQNWFIRRTVNKTWSQYRNIYVI